MPTVTPLSPPRLTEASPGTRPGPATEPARLLAPPAPDAAPEASATLPNPTLRLDASLGLVVLEFRNADGTARTIPNERELAAYRSAARAAIPGPASEATEPAEQSVAAAPEPDGVSRDGAQGVSRDGAQGVSRDGAQGMSRDGAQGVSRDGA